MIQNYGRFPQGLESISLVPLLHYRSCTETVDGPWSPLAMSPGHHRQKTVEEEKLLCLAGNLLFPSHENNQDDSVDLVFSKRWETPPPLQQSTWLAVAGSFSSGFSRACLGAGGLGWCVLSSDSADSPPKEMCGTGWNIQQARVFLLPVQSALSPCQRGCLWASMYICLCWMRLITHF